MKISEVLGVNAMSKLVDEIHAMHRERSGVNHETYKGLFAECCARIKNRAAMRHLPQTVVYKVPPMVWGRPPYKHHHAVRYVSEKLQRNGFEVNDAHGALSVSWKPAPAPIRSSKEAKPPTPSTQPKPPTPSKPAKTTTKRSTLSSRLDALRKQFDL